MSRLGRLKGARTVMRIDLDHRDSEGQPVAHTIDGDQLVNFANPVGLSRDGTAVNVEFGQRIFRWEFDTLDEAETAYRTAIALAR